MYRKMKNGFACGEDTIKQLPLLLQIHLIQTQMLMD